MLLSGFEFRASSVLWQPRRGSGRKNGRTDLCGVGAGVFGGHALPNCEAYGAA